MIKFSAQVTRIRWTKQGEERVELPAQFLPPGRIFLPKDSDVDEGDTIEEIMPDGDTRTFRLSDIHFMNAGGAPARLITPRRTWSRSRLVRLSRRAPR